MNFEVGTKYWTRDKHIALVTKIRKDKKYFRAEIWEGNARRWPPVIYNEIGDAVKPKNSDFDLMLRFPTIG